MPEQGADERKARGFERFLLFSDAVAAIAGTLLILPLVDAVTDTDGAGLTVVDILGNIRWEIFSFLLSFAVIILLWRSHQQTFNGAASYNATVLWAGMVWLLAIVILPFSTALIADHSEEQATLLIYVGNVAIAMYCAAVATWSLARNPELMYPNARISTAETGSELRSAMLVTLAFVVALIAPGVGFWVMAILALDTPLRLAIERVAGR